PIAPPTAAPSGPPTAPPTAAPVAAPAPAPIPVPTGCDPGSPVTGSGFASGFGSMPSLSVSVISLYLRGEPQQDRYRWPPRALRYTLPAKNKETCHARKIDFRRLPSARGSRHRSGRRGKEGALDSLGPARGGVLLRRRMPLLV